LRVDPYRRGGQHRDRYLVAEQLHIADVDPVAPADVVIDNSRLRESRIVQIRE
jgi:hypothetical protein